MGQTPSVISPIYYGISRLPEILEQMQCSKTAILTDSKAKKYCLPQLADVKAPVFTKKEGESGKTMAEAARLCTFLLHQGFDRQGVLVCLGGGTVTDLGAFAASIFKRGIRTIFIPTTLLAITDAAHGGKTAVNHAGIKNLIGTYHPASAIILHADFLKTLPEKELKNGLAEMLKHGLIADKKHWEWAWNYPELDWQNGIEVSVSIKNEIVKKDPFEKGVRRALNFGHTFGHALESCFENDLNKKIGHGYAIAAGMIMETHLSLKHGLPAAEHDRIVQVLLALYGKLKLKNIRFRDIWEKMLADKKNSNGLVQMAVLEKIGKGLWDCPVNRKEAKTAWDFYNNL